LLRLPIDTSIAVPAGLNFAALDSSFRSICANARRSAPLVVIGEQHDGIGALIIHLVSGDLVSGDLRQAV
jgi:hypothetical protein